jgi:hypothetical protein
METFKPSNNNGVQEFTFEAMLDLIEQGNKAGKEGNTDNAIDYYIKGLQIAREINNKPHITQISNLILTYI